MSTSEIVVPGAAAPEGGTDEGELRQLSIAELHAFEGHPFKVLDDELMQETVESIKSIGIVSPLVARPDPDGGYELISGHRRLHAAQLAGLDSVPVVVREMDDDAAIIFLVDSNIQREGLLPSERAFAYKMKLEAMNHQGHRNDLTCSQIGNKLDGKKSSVLMAEELGTSKNQIFRYIRLTNLIPALLDMVDQKKIAFNPAVELSYLTPSEQKDFLTAMDYGQAAPSLSQAQRIKKLSQEAIWMQEELENKTFNVAISTTKLTFRSIAKGVRAMYRKYKTAKNEKTAGKQTIEELIGQNQGVSSIPVDQTDLKGFEKVAKKYGVDFAIVKDKNVDPPKYTVFFKARDADALTAA